MSENLGVTVLFSGNNLPSLVKIGLTDLSKSGGVMALLRHPRDDRPVNIKTFFTLDQISKKYQINTVGFLYRTTPD